MAENTKLDELDISGIETAKAESACNDDTNNICFNATEALIYAVEALNEALRKECWDQVTISFLICSKA